jgi:hypothetical protein
MASTRTFSLVTGTPQAPPITQPRWERVRPCRSTVTVFGKDP